jgi:hypothetical protein
MGIRDTIYGGIQGTILQPGHDWIVNSWIQIGTLGFTYIAAASLALAIGGGLIMVFIVYGLFWQKLIQGKILQRNKQKTPGLGTFTPQGAPATPESAPQQIAKEPDKPEKVKEEVAA